MKKYEAAKNEAPMIEPKFLTKPFVGDTRVTRVEYKSTGSIDLPPGLELGEDNRKLGLGDKRTKKCGNN